MKHVALEGINTEFCIDEMQDSDTEKPDVSASYQDCDPDDYYAGPRNTDAILCGRSACTPISLRLGVTSVVSNG